MTFERFMASLYMSAMLQLGMMHEEGGQPRVDLIGARQTIDTLNLLQEKTKGNLTAAESNFLQNCSTSCAWLMWKSPTLWRARPRRPRKIPRRQQGSMKVTLTVLGSGTSMGVPTIGCPCPVCHSSDPHDRRTRPSVLLEYVGKIVLIDTTPDFREQAIREQINRVDAVLYTHSHADHILGIDDLRPLSYHRDGKFPCMRAPKQPTTSATCSATSSTLTTSSRSRPSRTESIDGPFNLFGAEFEPIPIIHGDTEIYGFRFGQAAYLTDFSEIPRSPLSRAWKASTCFFWTACVTSRTPRTPPCENSMRIADQVGAKRVFFTHICHDLPHEATNATLPLHVRLSYDGMKLEFEI